MDHRSKNEELDRNVTLNPDIFYVCNREGKLTKWNRALEELTGLGPETLLGMPAINLVVEEDRAVVVAEIQNVFASGFGYAELRFFSENGDHVPFICNGTPLRDEQGRVIGFSGTGRYISDRKQLEVNRERTLARQQALNQLQMYLLGSGGLGTKLKSITDKVVDIFHADFCRIWIVQAGDLCESGCKHARVTTGPNVCIFRDRCLHLVASSGRYTHIDGDHRRIPFGCYKIGRLASGSHTKFLTNNVKEDPQIHDRAWARKLDLKSFAGYQFCDVNGESIGVLALFSKHAITAEEDYLLENLGNTTAQVVQTSMAMESLKESEEKYRKIFNNEIDAISVFDITTRRILDVNDAFLNLYGYSRKEALQLTVDDLSGEPENSRAAVKRVAQEGDTLIPVRHHKTRDGKPIIVEISAGPFTWKGQKVMFAVTRNISDHIKAKEALARSEKKYRNLFHYSNDGIYVHDLEGNIIEVNQKALEQSNMTREEMLSSTITDLLSPDSLGKVDRFFKEISQLGHINFEAVGRKKNGELFPVEFSTSLLDLEGEKIVQSVVRDISERKKLEEEFLTIEKLKSTGILAGGIAHDFNNLLMAILGNISLAKLYARTDGKILERLNGAEKALARAKALTQQLLTFSKGGKPVRKPAVLNDLIKESISFALSGSNVKSSLSIADDLWPVVIDEDQISQVFQNIIKNADQAMPEGGMVTIHAQNKEISNRNPLTLNKGKYVEIQIIDTGEGIREENIAKVFDPYFSTKKDGSGLGLAGAYSIIKNHDGCITVDSSPGTGTTFSVYLPATDDVPSASQGDDDAGLSGQGKILIMDDELSIVQVAVEMLKYMGYTVEVALEGSEAISLYKKALGENSPFDAVMLDLTVRGGMGGKKTMKRLLEIDPGVKGIVSSGYANDPIMADYVDYGFINAISKPYTIEKLNRVLSQVLAEGVSQ